MIPRAGRVAGAARRARQPLCTGEAAPVDGAHRRRCSGLAARGAGAARQVANICGVPMKVLISGAGPAGLTVAYWLRRHGFAPTIVERAPSLLKGGYKIDARGTALQVLRRMGVHDAVVAASTDMQGALLVDGDGK